MNKIKMLFASLVMLAATLAGTAAPAHAGWPGGSVDYWRYYGGIVSYIILDCEGTYQSLHPGEWSKSIGGCADVNGFFVQSGSKLFCGERYGLRDYVYYPGWHDIGNFAYRACEMRAHNG
jgi:hypothetical protein